MSRLESTNFNPPNSVEAGGVVARPVHPDLIDPGWSPVPSVATKRGPVSLGPGATEKMNRDQMLAEISRLRLKVKNQRRNLRQLNDAHVQTLYNNRAYQESNANLVRIQSTLHNDLIREREAHAALQGRVRTLLDGL